MPEPIQQRRGQLLIPKDLDPFAKGEMTRNGRGVLWLNKSGHRDKRGKIGRGGVD
jgi:hypothetical protein